VIFFDKDDTSRFICLLVLHGGDSFEGLNRLRAPGVTTFENESVSCINIFQVLQHILTICRAKLVGDWKFMNAIKAIMQPGSTLYPCLICVVCKDNFFKESRPRKESDKHSRLPYEPFLTTSSDDIVPLPLHVMLGFVNKINKELMKRMGADIIKRMVGTIKTVHTRGGGGAADLHDLNGPEIKKWIGKKCYRKLTQQTNNTELKAALTTFQSWAEKIRKFCTQLSAWSSADFREFDNLYTDIKARWKILLKCDPTPKIHMLSHFPNFARKFGSVGKFSESPTESYHHMFKEKMERHHFNEPNLSSQARKALADTVTEIIATLDEKE
jgi:hypothetical protein